MDMNSDFDFPFSETHQRRFVEQVMAPLESADDVPDYTENDSYEPITQRKVAQKPAQLYRDLPEWSVSVSPTHV
jgi:hypothetical protein